MTTGRPQQFDKQQARNALLKHFWANGYTASSARDLQACSGLSASSLYRSFGNKEAAFIACLEHYTEQLIQSLEAMQNSSASSQEFFATLFRETAEQAETDAACLGCLIFNSIAEVGNSTTPPALAAKTSLESIRLSFKNALDADPQLQNTITDEERAVLADQLLMKMMGLRVLLRAGISRERALAMTNSSLNSLFQFTH